jgi:hypothetical protein
MNMHEQATERRCTIGNSLPLVNFQSESSTWTTKVTIGLQNVVKI